MIKPYRLSDYSRHAVCGSRHTSIFTNVTHLIDDTEPALETKGNHAEQTNRNGDDRMLQEKCHTNAERWRDIQGDQQPENSHEIHSQYQKLEDQHQYRVPEDPRVLDPYADVGEIRIKAVQYGQSSQQLAALQYGRGVDHGAGNQAIEDLQAISNRGDLGAKEVAHNGLSLPQGRDVTKATQTYVDKDVEDTEEGHLQVGLAHLLPDHMKGR